MIDFDLGDLYSWWDNHYLEYERDLSEYVAIPSVAGEKDGEYPFGKPCFDMLLFIKALMDKYGLKTTLINSVFAEGLIPGSGDKTIAIACHGDVVPVSGEWDRDPFTLYRKEDHLVGRGTTDNKGAGMAVLYSLRYLLEKGWKPKNTIRLLFGSSEESGMKDAEIAFHGEKVADLTLVPDSGFPVAYGEKGNLRYSFSLPFSDKIREVKAGSGVGVMDFASAEINYTEKLESYENITFEYLDDGWIRVEAKGKGRHSATPEGGVDALLLLFKYLSKYIDDDGINSYIALFPDFYGTGLGCNYSDQESGSLTAVVSKYENGEGKLGLRLPLSANYEIIKRGIEKNLPKATFGGETTGYRMEKDDRILALNKIANDEYESEKQPYVMAGGTYARVMQPAIAFGMGSPSGNATPPFPQGEGRAHQRNESVHIERMKKGFAIYVKALLCLEEY